MPAGAPPRPTGCRGSRLAGSAARCAAGSPNTPRCATSGTRSTLSRNAADSRRCERPRLLGTGIGGLGLSSSSSSCSATTIVVGGPNRWGLKHPHRTSAHGRAGGPLVLQHVEDDGAIDMLTALAHPHQRAIRRHRSFCRWAWRTALQGCSRRSPEETASRPCVRSCRSRSAHSSARRARQVVVWFVAVLHPQTAARLRRAAWHPPGHRRAGNGENADSFALTRTMACPPKCSHRAA
jgi:hypothetical protein